MTDTIDRPDPRIDCPELLAGLDEEIEEEQAQLKRLESLSRAVDESYAEAAALDPDGRRIVAEEMPEIRRVLPDADTIGELEDVQERLADVVADPYRRAVRRVRAEFLEVLGVADAVDEELTDRLASTHEDPSVDQLRDDREALERVTERLGDLSDAARTAVADELRDRWVGVLAAPAERLEPIVDRCADRHSVLASVDATLADVAWGPERTLADTAAYYGADVPDDDPETVDEYVSNIGDVTADVPDALPVERVLRAHLEQRLAEAEPISLETLFGTANERVNECVRDADAFERALALADAVDASDDSTAESVRARLAAVRSPPTEKLLTNEAPLAALYNGLDALAAEYDQWAQKYAQTLQADTVAVEAIRANVEWAPRFDPPEGGVAIPDAEVDADTVAQAPSAAVTTHSEYRAWVDALRAAAPGGADGNGSATVELLVELVRGRTVSAGDIDPETYGELVDLLDGGLELRFAGAR